MQFKCGLQQLDLGILRNYRHALLVPVVVLLANAPIDDLVAPVVNVVLLNLIREVRARLDYFSPKMFIIVTAFAVCFTPVVWTMVRQAIVY